MTNLERAAAIAAERGWPLVETYRWWPIYRTLDHIRWRVWGVHPYELDQQQFLDIWNSAFTKADGLFAEDSCLGIFCNAGAHVLKDDIDRWEAAREAMPATAFFGVEEEVGI